MSASAPGHRGTLDVEGTLSTAYFAGNVGIGTWVPAALLDVGGGKFKVDSAGDILGVFGTWNQYGALSTSAIGLSGGINIGGSIYFTNTSSLGWSSTNSSYGPVDIGLSRLSAGILGVGNGTAGDYSGTLTATNVGIGTFNVTGGSLIVKTGNVGIGSLTPGQALDVKGTIRTTNFTMTGQTPLVGYVLTASDTAGDATWSSAGGIAGWTVSGGNVYTTTGSNNVGIGTSTPQGGLVVTNGNVGIGTWVPVSALHISQNTGITWNGFGPPINTATLTIGAVGSSNSASLFVNTGAVSGSYPTGFGIDGNTTGVSGLNDTVVNLKAYSYQYGGDGGALAFWTSNGPAIAEKMRLDSNGNLGIGSTAPGQMLDVQGSLRILGNGSVGIGTAFIGGTGEAALTVMSGNVGIGTWVPASILQVNSGGAPAMSVGLDPAGFGVTGVITPGVYVTNIIRTPQIASLNYGTLTFGISSYAPNPYLFNGTGQASDGTANVTWLTMNGNTAGYLGSYTSNNMTTGSVNAVALSNSFNAPTSTYNSSTAPMIELKINPTFNVSTSSTTGYTEIYSKPIETSISSTAANYFIQHYASGASTPNFSVTESGNVGIGTISPTGALQVVGSGNAIAVPSCTLGVGQAMCWGTGGCLGYCTAGTYPACSTCICC